LGVSGRRERERGEKLGDVRRKAYDHSTLGTFIYV